MEEHRATVGRRFKNYPMRIAILMNIGSPWSREVALLIANAGHEVFVIDFVTDDWSDNYIKRNDGYQVGDIVAFESAVAGIRLLRTIWKSNFRYLSCAGQLRQNLVNDQIEILLTLYGGGNATMAWLSAFRPYVAWVVGSDILLTSGMLARVQALALSKAALVPANGRYLADRAQVLAPRAKVKMLLHGLDLTKYRRSQKPAGEVVVLCTRGFTPIYQNDFIVRGIAQLSEPVAVQCRFVFAASGPELENVKTLACSIMDDARMRRLEFIGGVGRERMLALLDQAHIFVSMARSDGTATSLLEALACGLYPILSDIPANREWVSADARNGRLVQLDSPVDFASQLEAAIAERDRWCEIGEKNRRALEERADGRLNIGKLLVELEAIRGAKRPN